MRTLEKNQFWLVEINREKQKRDGPANDRFGFSEINDPFYQGGQKEN